MTPLRLAPSDDLEPLVRALDAGEAVLVPTDTVYGLACAAHLPHACERMLELKGRDLSKPTSIVCGSLERLLEHVLPGLDGRTRALARRLLPGPVTLVVANPAGRFPWLCGPDASRIGVRVPALDSSLAAAIDRVGAIAATSANLAGGDDPSSPDAVPDALLAHLTVVLDAGPTPGGTPSTVIDVTGRDPVVVRRGALSEAEIGAMLVD
jgi:L-threonylcarbamoyladenylate synthase